MKKLDSHQQVHSKCWRQAEYVDAILAQVPPGLPMTSKCMTCKVRCSLKLFCHAKMHHMLCSKAMTEQQCDAPYSASRSLCTTLLMLRVLYCCDCLMTLVCGTCDITSTHNSRHDKLCAASLLYCNALSSNWSSALQKQEAMQRVAGLIKENERLERLLLNEVPYPILYVAALSLMLHW